MSTCKGCLQGVSRSVSGRRVSLVMRQTNHFATATKARVASARNLLTTDLSTHPLEFVIHLAPHVLVGISDDAHHVVRSMALVEAKREALAQTPDRALAFETGKARSEHELHGRNELRGVRAEREEGGDAELLEERVALGAASAHQDDHFVVELERAGLELDAAGA